MSQKIKKNDEIIVDIDRLGDNGEGIASFDGEIVFVPYAKVGERVRVHIINDKHKFLVGKITQKIIENDEKIVPKCPYFYKCGGCDVQHLSKEEQLELKKNIVKNNLKKIAKIDTEIQDVVASDKQFRYRNKFSFPVQDVDGKIKIGMYQKNSHNIIEIEDCLLQSENVKLILKLFKEYMIENKIPAYNERTKKGIVKHIVCREYDNQFILTVVVTDEKFNNFGPLIEKIKTQFGHFGITKNVNKLNNNVIFGNLDDNVYGIDNLHISEFGIDYQINNRSFFQVNNYIKTEIYKKIIDLLSGQKIIVDAYSGAGLLSSILAKNFDRVYGIEIEKEATKNADYLKNKNKLDNLTNINGNCAVALPKLICNLKDEFAIVVDPPRKGLDKKVVDAFLQVEPNQIVYLSCNPATLARDLQLLSSKYSVEFVQPYDMFPQTANVETLVNLKLKK